jgi:hypothetical protein
MVSLVVVREYKHDRKSHYILKYVQIDDRLKQRLKQIFKDQINEIHTVEKYTIDCPEPEADEARTINSSNTDFVQIYDQLSKINPAVDIIEGVDELVQSKAYMIVLSNTVGIQAIGFKKVPENWKMKKKKGLISLLFKENRFKDLEEENVFSISNTVEMIYHDDQLYILSKKAFEHALNFRVGMESKADQMYEEVERLKIFVNIDVLREKVGNNQRYLRKITIIKDLGHYNDPQFLEKLQRLNVRKRWNIQFENGQILFTDDTLDDILTILQNKRLHSELTNQDFDVDSAKPVGN